MIEFAMIFGLGALAATLLALSALPALDRRAQRLAKRRLEALFPMSIAEIAAERDHVRAAMAVEARRAELKAETKAREKASDLAEIGRRDVTIHALNETVAARDAAIVGHERTISGLSNDLAQMTSDRDSARSDLGATRAAFDFLQSAHAQQTAKLAATEAVAAQRDVALQELRAGAAAMLQKLTEREDAFANLQIELRKTTDLATGRQLTIAALDAQLETALGEARETARQLVAARDMLGQRDAVIARATAERDEAKERIVVLEREAAEARATVAPVEVRPVTANDDAPPAVDHRAAKSPRNTSRRKRSARRKPPAITTPQAAE
ncbi:hypothetical protein [Terrarubrum flagellatum]|uniref:hypothetical protein n=1 Tax=Terrirubrum flagellatum TaxID=2895980 RepID=UPI003145489F